MGRLQRVLPAFHLAGAGDEDDAGAAADDDGGLEAFGQGDDGVRRGHGGAFDWFQRRFASLCRDFESDRWRRGCDFATYPATRALTIVRAIVVI